MKACCNTYKIKIQIHIRGIASIATATTTASATAPCSLPNIFAAAALEARVIYIAARWIQSKTLFWWVRLFSVVWPRLHDLVTTPLRHRAYYALLPLPLMIGVAVPLPPSTEPGGFFCLSVSGKG